MTITSDVPPGAATLMGVVAFLSRSGSLWSLPVAVFAYLVLYAGWVVIRGYITPTVNARGKRRAANIRRASQADGS